MTRTTVAKLAVFIFLAFIVCLPEFFPSDTEIQVCFFCSPFDPCETTSGHGPNNDGQDCKGAPLESQDEGGARPLCKEEPTSATNQDELTKDWFVCETQTDLQSLHDNTSLSGVDVKVVLSLRTMNLSLQNVTTHGHLTWNGLLIGTFQNLSLVHCCVHPADRAHALPAGPLGSNTSRATVPSKLLASPAESGAVPLPRQPDSAPKPARRLKRSQCFLHYPATTVSRTPAKKGRWWCFPATVWLVLVLIVVVVVLMSTGVQVCSNRNCCHKQAVSVQSTAGKPRRFSKLRIKSLGDLPDGFHTEDEVLFMEKTPEDHTRGLFPITETSVGEDEGEDISDCTVTEEGSKESLDIGQTPAHTQSDFLTHLHHRCHSVSQDKDGGM